MFQLCLCGTQPGYPHAEDCPYPLYRAAGPAEARWTEARDRRRFTLAAQAERRHDDAARPWTVEEILRREG